MASKTFTEMGQEFFPFVQEGKALNEHLWADINQLDALMQNEGEIEAGATYQLTPLDGRSFNKWTPYVTTATVGNTFETIRESVETLCRGVGRRQEEFTHPPLNYSIRINTIQDQEFRVKVKGIGETRQGTGAQVEAIYNPIDGFVIVNHIELTEAVLADFVPDTINLSPSYVLAKIWMLLHSTGTEKKEPDPRTGSKAIGAWMSAMPGMNRERLFGTRNFLNYIFFQFAFKDEIVDVIKYCFYHNNVQPVLPLWGDRVTFRVGHWAFYALLGTRIGRIVVEMLAPRKATTALGHKVVKSITLFVGNDPQNLTEEEREEYATLPIILFELVDLEDVETAAALSLEKNFTENDRWMVGGPNGEPRPHIYTIKQPQIGTPNGNLMAWRPPLIDTSAFE